MIDLFTPEDPDAPLMIGIVGTRRRDSARDLILVEEAFLSVWVPGRTTIVSGGCPQGGDRFAEILIAKHHCGDRIHRPDASKFEHVPPRWRKTQANYFRNGLIARDSKDGLIACVAPDRTGGTEDTIKKYERLWKKKAIIV